MQTVENLKCLDKIAYKTDQQILHEQHRTKLQNPELSQVRASLSKQTDVKKVS